MAEEPTLDSLLIEVRLLSQRVERLDSDLKESRRGSASEFREIKSDLAGIRAMLNKGLGVFAGVILLSGFIGWLVASWGSLFGGRPPG